MRHNKRSGLRRAQAQHAKRLQAAASPTRIQSLLVGVLVGATLAVVVGAGIVLFAIFGASLIIWLFTGFRGSDLRLLGLALATIAVAVLAVLGADWVLRRTSQLRQDGWGKASMALGVVLTLAVALVLAPEGTRNEVLRMVTWYQYHPRPPSLPASETERRYLREVLRPAAEAGDARAQFRLGIALRYGQGGAKVSPKKEARWIRRAADQPDGAEARLLLAVERMLPPNMARIVSDEDKQAKVQALLDLPEAQLAAWRPLVLGAIGNVQQSSYDGGTPADAPMREAWAEAGRAGSRAAAILAAGMYELAAHLGGGERYREREDEIAANKQRAMEGYARAGSLYDQRRLQREGLEPESRAATTPQTKPWHTPDAAWSQRLQELAEMLGGDAIPSDRISSSNYDLAAAAALLAMELAPDPAALSSTQAGRRGAQSRSVPLQRWLLALRHARGDCLAALEFSKRLKGRDDQGQDTPITTLNTAWAVAWAESAQRCAGDDGQRAEVAHQLHMLGLFRAVDHTTDEEIEAARADVAALLADLH